MKQILRTALLLSLACVLMAGFSALAQAQKFDVAAGGSGITAPGSEVANDIDHQPESLRGGTYLNVSGDYLFHHSLGGVIGVEGEFARRASETFSQVYNHNYRPMFYDANAIYTRRFYKHFVAELEGGAGMETVRFYTGGCHGGSNCYADNNHFMVDAGAGIKMYPVQRWFFHHIFLRPEGRVYFIRNNQEFSSARAIRFGASIGYSFK